MIMGVIKNYCCQRIALLSHRGGTLSPLLANSETQIAHIWRRCLHRDLPAGDVPYTRALASPHAVYKWTRSLVVLALSRHACSGAIFWLQGGCSVGAGPSRDGSGKWRSFRISRTSREASCGRTFWVHSPTLVSGPRVSLAGWGFVPFCSLEAKTL